MPVPVALNANDDMTLDRLAADAALAVPAPGSVARRIEALAVTAGVPFTVQQNDRLSIEALALLLGAEVCAVSLSGDIATVFTGVTLEISGQAVSMTVPESPANMYAAGGEGLAVSWEGWRGIGYQASVYTVAGDSFHGFTLISSTYAVLVQLLWSDSTGAWLVMIGGAVAGNIAGSALDKVGMRVDGASGDVELLVGATVKTKADFAGLDALFDGLTVIPALTLGTSVGPTLAEGDAYAAEVYVSADALAAFSFEAGTLDWCGDLIGGA